MVSCCKHAWVHVLCTSKPLAQVKLTLLATCSFLQASLSRTSSIANPKRKINLSFAFFAGPSPPACEQENKYAALFEPNQDIPFAFLVAIPITLLFVLLALFIRALERAKRRYGAGLVNNTDRNGDGVAFRNTSCNSNKESANQVTCLVSS